MLDVGRKRRTIPTAIRRAVSYRDGGCRFPGCGLRIVDDHHLHHWIDGGETKVSNIAELCRRHHRLVHEGGFKMELLKNGEVKFYRPDGRLVPNTAPRPRVEAEAEARIRRLNDRPGLDIGPWTANAGTGSASTCTTDCGHCAGSTPTGPRISAVIPNEDDVDPDPEDRSSD